MGVDIHVDMDLCASAAVGVGINVDLDLRASAVVDVGIDRCEPTRERGRGCRYRCRRGTCA